MTTSARGMMLADLNAAVDELTQPRPHIAMIEDPRGQGSRRIRRRHITQLPPLLDAVARAAEPEVTGETMRADDGGESKPPVNLDAAHALRVITHESGHWARALRVPPRATLEARLRALAKRAAAAPTCPTAAQLAPPLPDARLGDLALAALRWADLAKRASREDAPAITLNAPCPYCARRNALQVAGTLDSARCTRCGRSWDDVTIGLLGEMIRHGREAAVS